MSTKLKSPERSAISISLTSRSCQSARPPRTLCGLNRSDQYRSARRLRHGFALCRGSRICPSSSMSLWRGAMPCWRSQSCGPLSRHAAGARPHSRCPLQFHWFCPALPSCSAATTSPNARIGLTTKALCRLYEADLSAVSNSYALKSTFAADGMNSRGSS
jgi:hypothetical protein